MSVVMRAEGALMADELLEIVNYHFFGIWYLCPLALQGSEAQVDGANGEAMSTRHSSITRCRAQPHTNAYTPGKRVLSPTISIWKWERESRLKLSRPLADRLNAAFS
eukprot:scaffold325985_cov61-Tisochrysis_lutea.AAC.3